MVMTHRCREILIVLAAAAFSAIVGIVITLQDGPHLCSYPALCRLRPDGGCVPNPPCPGSGYHWWWVVMAAFSGAAVAAVAMLIRSLHGERPTPYAPSGLSQGM